jgi:hypothetical protein
MTVEPKDTPVAPQVSGSKTLVIPQMDQKAPISMVSSLDLDEKMKLFSNSVRDIQECLNGKSEQPAKSEDYVKLCAHLKELIAGVEYIVAESKQSQDAEYDDDEGQGNNARLKESISDIKQGMKLIEDRYAGLSNLAGDTAPQNREDVGK